MCKEEDPAYEPDQPYLSQPGLTVSPSRTVPRDGDLVIEDFPLVHDGYNYRHGKIAYIKGRPPSPVVIVHHNYAGLKQFDVDQAAFLARCGFVGVAIDTYREVGLVGHADQSREYRFEDRDPKRDLAGYGKTMKGQTTEAQKARALRHLGAYDAMMGLLRSPVHWRDLMAAWLTKARTHPAAHPRQAGAIGYCLGGQALLEQVRAGHDLQAVVSFHGLLHSRPGHPTRQGNFAGRMTAAEFEADPTIEKAANSYARNCKVLIENGDADDHVPPESKAEFKAEMDAQCIDWRINDHARVPHGFALPPGLWSTAYHEDADRRSTLSMLSLFAEVWPGVPQHPVAANACGTVLGQSISPIGSKL